MNWHENMERANPHSTADDELLQRHTYPVHTDEYWRDFERSVMARVEKISSPVSVHKPNALPNVSKLRKLLMFTPISMLRAAAVLVLGIGIGFAAGRFADSSSALSLSTASRETAQQGQQAQRATESSTLTAAVNYLEASHLLLLGMASLSGECGVHTSRTVQTLVSQRECSRALLLKTTAINQELAELPPSEHRDHLRSLITQVAFALSEIAAMEPATLDAVRIEQIQSCSDNALCELNARRRIIAARAVMQ